MELGHNHRNNKLAAEVNYYEQPDAIQIMACDGSGSLAPKSNGGNNLLALQAAGAWVGSATDIMKLLLALDGFSYPADIYQRFGCRNIVLGWRSTNRYGHWIRTGSMAGTSAVLKRRPDGVSFVILCNTSAWIGPDYPFKLASFADREINRIKTLPDHDLFEEQQKLYLSFK